MDTADPTEAGYASALRGHVNEHGLVMGIVVRGLGGMQIGNWGGGVGERALLDHGVGGEMRMTLGGGLWVHGVLLRVWARLVGRIRVGLLVGIEERRGGPAERRATSARGILGSFWGVVHLSKGI